MTQRMRAEAQFRARHSRSIDFPEKTVISVNNQGVVTAGSENQHGYVTVNPKYLPGKDWRTHSLLRGAIKTPEAVDILLKSADDHGDFPGSKDSKRQPNGQPGIYRNVGNEPNLDMINGGADERIILRKQSRTGYSPLMESLMSTPHSRDAPPRVEEGDYIL